MRVKSPNPVISSWFGVCRVMSFPQVSDERLVSPDVGSVRSLARPPSTDGAPRPVSGARSTDRVGEWDGRSSGLLVRWSQ